MKNFDLLRDGGRDILECEIKDETGLNDFQKLTNHFGVAIPKVGIERFRLPLPIQHRDGTIMNHDGEASMFVFLEETKTGVNMSRFCQILQRESAAVINGHNIAKILNCFRDELRDDSSEELIARAYLDLKFNYATKQPSLKSGHWGWQYYETKWSGVAQKGGETLFQITLKYEYSSTCPCSLSMAKQYEQDYRDGKTSEGNGIATAHSQRSIATVTVTTRDQSFHPEDLVRLLREAIPTETQSLVKRIDEQAFAILNGETPMFVEHASRRLHAVLDKVVAIEDWEAKIEHIESLHSHNAVAYIRK